MNAVCDDEQNIELQVYTQLRSTLYTLKIAIKLPLIQLIIVIFSYM